MISSVYLTLFSSLALSSIFSCNCQKSRNVEDSNWNSMSNQEIVKQLEKWGFRYFEVANENLRDQIFKFNFHKEENGDDLDLIWDLMTGKRKTFTNEEIDNLLRIGDFCDATKKAKSKILGAFLEYSSCNPFVPSTDTILCDIYSDLFNGFYDGSQPFIKISNGELILYGIYNDTKTMEMFLDLFCAIADNYKMLLFQDLIVDLKTANLIQKCLHSEIISLKFINCNFPLTYFDAFEFDFSSLVMLEVFYLVKCITLDIFKFLHRLPLEKLIELDISYSNLPEMEGPASNGYSSLQQEEFMKLLLKMKCLEKLNISKSLDDTLSPKIVHSLVFRLAFSSNESNSDNPLASKCCGNLKSLKAIRNFDYESFGSLFLPEGTITLEELILYDVRVLIINFNLISDWFTKLVSLTLGIDGPYPFNELETCIRRIPSLQKIDIMCSLEYFELQEIVSKLRENQILVLQNSELFHPPSNISQIHHLGSISLPCWFEYPCLEFNKKSEEFSSVYNLRADLTCRNSYKLNFDFFKKFRNLKSLTVGIYSQLHNVTCGILTELLKSNQISEFSVEFYHEQVIHDKLWKMLENKNFKKLTLSVLHLRLGDEMSLNACRNSLNEFINESTNSNVWESLTELKILDFFNENIGKVLEIIHRSKKLNKLTISLLNFFPRIPRPKPDNLLFSLRVVCIDITFESLGNYEDPDFFDLSNLFEAMPNLTSLKINVKYKPLKFNFDSLKNLRFLSLQYDKLHRSLVNEKYLMENLEKLNLLSYFELKRTSGSKPKFYLGLFKFPNSMVPFRYKIDKNYTKLINLMKDQQIASLLLNSN